MSWTQHLRGKIAYNEWANEKLFAAAFTLGDDVLNAERSGTSYGSLAKDLEHVTGVQGWWHSVAADISYIAEGALPASGVSEELGRRLSASNAALGELADSLTEDSLDGTIERSRGAETWRWAQWQVIEHLLNHSAHHRAEIGQVLHSLGASPGDMDFIFWLNA